MNDLNVATVCLVMGFAVTTYYYRVIRRGNYRLSPIAMKGEDWFHTPNKLRIPMWIAGSFSAASCLELLSLFLGFKLSDIEPLSFLLPPIVSGLLLSLFEKNPFYLSDSQRKYPSFISMLVLGAALALLICDRL